MRPELPRAARRWTLAISTLLLALLTHCATRPSTPLGRHEFHRTEMGMDVRIVLYAANATTAQTAALAALDRIRELNAIFSDYEDDSELSRLSRTAGRNQSVPLSPELWQVLLRSQALARKSHGAFDVTVGPAVSLWRRARRTRELPRPDQLARARAATGYTRLELNPSNHTARLISPNMRLDLGGIAKGYALDEALRVLQRHGIRSALVNAGGDLVASDPPPGAKGWRIALGSLRGPDVPPTEWVLLARRALATSGDLFQFVEIDGARYSHIVDPRTGIALTARRLVHVLAPDGCTADGLSTALSVLAPSDGLALARSTPRVQARIVHLEHDEARITQSPGFARYLAP